MSLIIKEFNSPLDTHKITSRHGYMYSVCARQLFYASEQSEIGHTLAEFKMMNWGMNNHTVVKDWLRKNFPEQNFRFEQHYERQLPERIGGIDYVGATYDVVAHKMAIEIKPKYNLKAYIQIKVEAFVNPTWEYFVFQYMNLLLAKKKLSLKEILFPVTSGTEKDSVYVSRIITALNHKPPRFPNANEQHPICRTCLFFDRCYSESEISWNTFGQISKLYLSKIQNVNEQSNQTLQNPPA